MEGNPNNPRNQLRRRIAPGIWEDRAGHIHWSIPELLKMVDLPETPENMAKVRAMLEEQMKTANPGVKIIHRERPD